MRIVGQNKIVNKINSGNIPNPLLIIGNKGMGKHTLCDYIYEKSNIDRMEDISDYLSHAFIDELYLNVIPEFIIIDFSKIGQHKRVDIAQNIILKLIEEPPITEHIILLADDKSHVLDTILNRCQIWELEDYSVDELKIINPDINTLSSQEIQTLIHTPYDAINYKETDLKSIITLCDTIATKISNSNVSNMLTIVDKLNFSNDDDKFNIDLFLNVLLCTFESYMNSTKFPQYYEAWRLTHSFKNKTIRLLNVNKKYLFYQFLIDLRGLLEWS